MKRVGLIVLLTFILCSPLSAIGIRIVPHAITVSRDSLRFDLAMDLQDVRVASGSSLTFTLLLRQGGKQLLLPGVVITGARRARFARRERELSPVKQGQAPYFIYIDHRKGNEDEKRIRYRLAVPYASWMRHASLELLHESTDCCYVQTVGLDTLSCDLNLPIRPEPDGAGTAFAGIQPNNLRLDTVLSVNSRYTDWVTFLTPALNESVKQRVSSAVAYIDYHRAEYEVDLDYRNNRREIDKIDSLFVPLLNGNLSTLHTISIRGYASPDGNYSTNERLSYNRSLLFTRLIREAYRIPETLFQVSSVAEDWAGLRGLLEQNRPTYWQSAVSIIDGYATFAGREKQLMDLQGGVPYKEMLHTLFPKLRRIEVVVNHEVRNVTDAEAAQLIYTHPELLNLKEIYSVARFYRPGTEQYREVYEIAARLYPNEVTVNVNAASAALLLGDITAAWNYLRKVDGDPRTYNDLGVLSLLEGDLQSAESWFRKAIGTEPEKARKNLAKVQAMRKGVAT